MAPPAPDRALRFLPNRVWRCYTGGLLLDRWRGTDSAQDGHLPEDWLASATRALNGPNSQGPDEGLSRVALDDGQPGPLLTELLASDPAGYLGTPGRAELGVLCKYLDSAVRLPIQCHPDRAFARTHYHSPHGKAESWLILDARTIGGEPPCLLLGFRPGVDEAAFRRAVHRQDIPALVAMLHRVPARPGDCWFIPGRLPHAIGAGVFMLEVQEPSDWVVQPERFCAAQPLTDNDMWGPLAPELALRCFDYRGEELDQVRQRLLLRPRPLHEEPGHGLHEIIGPATTDCFAVQRLTATAPCTIPAPPGATIAIVTAGRGELANHRQRSPVRRGDVLLLPAHFGPATWTPHERLELFLVQPGPA
jgi:mannose-6-phosphate isomerase